METTTDTTAKEINRVNRLLVGALRARATARARLTKTEGRVTELRRSLRLLLQSVLIEDLAHDQRGDADLEQVAAELNRPNGTGAGWGTQASAKPE